MNLTPAQRQAIAEARRGLATEAVSDASDAFWRGYFRGLLLNITEAFPEGGTDE